MGVDWSRCLALSDRGRAWAPRAAVPHLPAPASPRARVFEEARARDFRVLSSPTPSQGFKRRRTARDAPKIPLRFAGRVDATASHRAPPRQSAPPEPLQCAKPGKDPGAAARRAPAVMVAQRGRLRRRGLLRQFPLRLCLRTLVAASPAEVQVLGRVQAAPPAQPRARHPPAASASRCLS